MVMFQYSRKDANVFTGSLNYCQTEYEAASVNFFIHFCSSPFLSSRSNTCLLFNKFHVFGNLHDIDFALSCMDILAINAQISIN